MLQQGLDSEKWGHAMGRDGAGSPLSCSPAPEQGIWRPREWWVAPLAPRGEADRCARLSSASLLSLCSLHARPSPRFSPLALPAIVWPSNTCSAFLLPLRLSLLSSAFLPLSFLTRLFVVMKSYLWDRVSRAGGRFGDDGYVHCLEMVMVSSV